MNPVIYVRTFIFFSVGILYLILLYFVLLRKYMHIITDIDGNYK